MADGFFAEMPRERGGAAVDAGWEINLAGVRVHQRDAQCVQLGDGVRQVLLREANFVMNAIAAASFGPIEAVAIAFKSILFGVELIQLLVMSPNVHHDAAHERQHLAGGAKIQRDFFSPTFAGRI